MHSIRAVADSLARDLDGEVTYVHDPFRPTVVLDDRAAVHVLGEIGEAAVEVRVENAIAEEHAEIRRGMMLFAPNRDIDEILELADYVTRHVAKVFEVLNIVNPDGLQFDPSLVENLVAELFDSKGQFTGTVDDEARALLGLYEEDE